MFQNNLPMEEIQKYTGLSIEEIEAFRKEMEQNSSDRKGSYRIEAVLFYSNEVIRIISLLCKRRFYYFSTKGLRETQFC